MTKQTGKLLCEVSHNGKTIARGSKVDILPCPLERELPSEIAQCTYGTPRNDVVLIRPSNGTWGEDTIPLIASDSVFVESTKLTTYLERLRAIRFLQRILPPGTIVYTSLRSVSRSGMNRRLRVFAIDSERNEIGDITYYVARAMGEGMNDSGVAVGGCGMDVGFHLVMNLSYTIHPNGFQCCGKHCPSNEHSNPPCPQRDGKIYHATSGYSLSHRWL